jgi:hypothetical protein
MNVLSSVDWRAVERHYRDRAKASQSLAQLLQQQAASSFANLALGISNPSGNYSSVEHGLGPKILGSNAKAEARILALAKNFSQLDRARIVPELIRNARLKYLQIGVGSEISCMINPKVCWVANTRTIWTHLVIKHNDNIGKADQELALYREADVTSEMAYQMWAAIHAELDVALTRVGEIGKQLAKSAGIVPGDITYLWADAIASALYDRYHG